MNSRKPILLALLAGLAIVAAACSGSDSVVNSGQGQVRISLSSGVAAATTGAALGTMDDDHDDQGRSIIAAAVTFSSILARNLDGQLIPITSPLPVTIDIMTILAGGQVDLPAGTLPPGTYDQIVVVMTRVDLTLSDGTIVSITPPGGGWTVVVPTQPFTVVEGGTTTLSLRTRGDAFDFVGDHFEFDPEFDCRED